MSGLRVVSFNVRNGRAFDGWHSWPFRRRSTAAVVEGLGAAVVGLQEVYACQQRYLLRRLPRLQAVGEGRSGAGRGERCPVLWDPAVVSVVEHRTRWYGADPDRPGTRLAGARFPRVATLCRLRLEVGGGQEVQLVNTHLDAADRGNRIASAEQLAAWLDPAVPRIVLGDLNATPDSPVLAPLLDAGLRDALVDVPGGTEHRFTGATDGRRIDHVLVSDDIEVVSAWIAHGTGSGRLPSDHWPVVADLRL